MHLHRSAWILIVIAAALAVFAALFNWNWLRAPLASWLSHKTGRTVTINGDLHGELALKPLLTADKVTLGNAAWGTDPVMASAQQVALRLNLLSLFRGPVSLPELSLVQPVILLERDAEGHPNWALEGSGEHPRLGRLSIDAGKVHFIDPRFGVDISANLASTASTKDTELTLRFDGGGRMQENEFTLEGSAITPLALDVRDRSYQLDVQARSATTSMHFSGIATPGNTDASDLEGKLALQGDDLARLRFLVRMPFTRTPPYRFNGNLRHGRGVWTYDEATGNVGQSDLSGRLVVDRRKGRAQVEADVVSRRIQYKDLAELLHLPGSTAPKARGAANKGAVAAGKTDGRAPFFLPGIRSADATVRIKGKQLSGAKLPLENVDAVIEVKDGVLTVRPLDFDVGGGHVVSALTLDARGAVGKATAELTARNVELGRIVPSLKPPTGSAGKVAGRAQLSAAGNSIADLVSTTNGQGSFLSSGGHASELSLLLANFDLSGAVELLLRGDANTGIRCAVTNLVAEKGVVDVKTLVVDTETEKVVGNGKIDFVNKRYDLKLEAKSKRPSLVALGGPIVIDGSFGKPHVHRAGNFAARVGASVVLGIVNPFAALVPLIDVGGATDANCQGLIQRAKDSVDGQTAATGQRTQLSASKQAAE